MPWNDVKPCPVRPGGSPSVEFRHCHAVTSQSGFSRATNERRVCGDVGLPGGCLQQSSGGRLPQEEELCQLRREPSQRRPTAHAAATLRARRHPPLTVGVPRPYQTPPPQTHEDDLQEDVLLRLLDDSVDERYLSIERPAGSILYPNGTMETNFKKGLPKDELAEEIQHLKFPRPSLGGSQEVRVKDSAYRRLIRQYLWASSYCPVVYKWADLGPNFWPRWINEGTCYNGRSCSIPAGMSCHPHEVVEVSILFWRCRSRRSCDWIPFRHQIVSKCQCGCWHFTLTRDTSCDTSWHFYARDSLFSTWLPQSHYLSMYM